jgi:hypothetical protein
MACAEQILTEGTNPAVSTILIASASTYERDRLVIALEGMGWILRPVANAKEAARVCGTEAAHPILVIDGGLLDLPGDGAWRELRNLHPRLVTVVRCFVDREAIERSDANTLRVHPSNIDGLCEAIGLLNGSAARSRRTP